MTIGTTEIGKKNMQCPIIILSKHRIYQETEEKEKHMKWASTFKYITIPYGIALANIKGQTQRVTFDNNLRGNKVRVLLSNRHSTISGAFIIDDIAGKKPGYHDLIADYDYYVRTFGNLDLVKNSEKDPLWCLDQAIAAGEAPQLYLACGEDDLLLRENKGMKAELEQRTVKFEYHESPGIHDWVFWNEYLEKAVKWTVS